jgi:hypothetical protein
LSRNIEWKLRGRTPRAADQPPTEPPQLRPTDGGGGGDSSSNLMTWRRRLPDGRIQTITTSCSNAEAANWREQLHDTVQQRRHATAAALDGGGPGADSQPRRHGLTPRAADSQQWPQSWAIRVRWMDGGTCSETDQFNAPGAFVAFGALKSAVFKPGKQHGWLDFEDASAAFVGRVCAQMDGQLVCGRQVRLEPVENRPDQWSSSGGEGRGGGAAAQQQQQQQQQQWGAGRPGRQPDEGHAPATMAHQERGDRERRLQQQQQQQQQQGGDGGDDGATDEFWRAYTLDLQGKGSYIPRHLRKFLE